MYMRAAVEIAAGGRPPPHLPFDFDSSIMVSKLTANRTGVVDDCESTCSPVRQGIFIVPFFLVSCRGMKCRSLGVENGRSVHFLVVS